MAYWFNLLIEKERRRREIVSAAERRHQKRMLSRVESRGGLLDDGGRQTADGDRGSRFQRRGGFLRGCNDFLRSRYELFLASLGHRLIIWGHRLQKRYERFSETTSFGVEQLDFVSERDVDSSNGARSR